MVELQSQLNNNKSELWVFADNLTQPIRAEFVEYEQRKARNGNDFPVFIFKNNNHKQIIISAYRCDYRAVELKFGTNTDLWKGNFFDILLDDGNIKIVPMTEQKIN